jgi:hypothetical protein
MHKNATKCNETLSKWCKNKHGASKIIDTFETYHWSADVPHGLAAVYILVCQNNGDLICACMTCALAAGFWGD